MSDLAEQPVLPMTLEQVFTSADDVFTGNGPASRDLGLGSASNGIFTARRVRVGQDGVVNAVATDASAWFTFVYILEGEVSVHTEQGVVLLRPHDAATQVLLDEQTVIAASPYLQFLEIQASDTEATRRVLPVRPRQTVSLDSPDAHVLGTGPRSFFDYRNLGVADSTDRQIEVQVVRAQRAKEGGTGWHSHNMAQLTYGLNGWGLLDIEGVPHQVYHRPGDGFSIPAHWRHNAGAFSDDYWALQLQVPADYDTFVRDEPEIA